MKQPKFLLRTAGVLTLLTCLGHTAGTFMPIPAKEVEVVKAAAVMKATLVPMPVGKAQTYADIFLGNNIGMSVFLFVLGLGFFFFSGKDGLAGVGRRLLTLNSLGALAISVLSALFFFPVPAAFTGLAALLGLTAARGAGRA
ncbi:MAG: hypothetical protein KF713_18370 [Turneriella sp.]|nr:hypothetical protein [Turneriella sp.]